MDKTFWIAIGFVVLLILAVIYSQSRLYNSSPTDQEKICQIYGVGSIKDVPAICLKYYVNPSNTIYSIGK